jgi:hypothetical protein
VVEEVAAWVLWSVAESEGGLRHPASLWGPGQSFVVGLLDVGLRPYSAPFEGNSAPTDTPTQVGPR